MKHCRYLVAVVMTMALVGAAFAEPLVNCGSGRSASLGDLKEKVRLQCGEPQRTEILGYIDKVQGTERIRVMKIEEWIYYIEVFGQRHSYSLVFEGNELTKIQDVGTQ